MLKLSFNEINESGIGLTEKKFMSLPKMQNINYLEMMDQQKRFFVTFRTK